MTQETFVKINEIYDTNNFGKYIVLSKEGIDKNRRFLFKIRFLETGYETIVTSNQIYKKEIKDYLFKNCCGIGYLEKPYCYFKNKEIYGTLSEVWRNILSRCYNKNCINYNIYGGNGATVSERWHSFWNFYNDAQYLFGWNEDLFLEGKIQLDKDTKQLFKENKIYSTDTCIWLNSSKNRGLHEKNLSYLIKGVSPEGEEYIFNGIKSFAKKHGLTAPDIYPCLNNNSKKHKGWSFERIS